MELQQYSFLTPYGYQPGSCGYCKDENTSQRTPCSRGSYYANSTKLTVDHYQSLVDRGWRRSGQTLYKPDLQRSCCPHYTIRLDTEDFKPSKHQRQCLNQWKRHILGPEYHAQLAKLRPPKSREEKRATRDKAFDLLAAVHESEVEQLENPAPTPHHRYQVTLEADDFTDEKYALFEQYQRLVHHEPPKQISKSGFRRFLCDSPLVRTARTVEGKEQQLGSFHQMHRLDGKLIALSVLDLLPHAVSAVYFIYHATPISTSPDPSVPDSQTSLSNFSPGKLSALREAALAREHSLRYYYMGFYIHSCTKMRYKAEFRPQLVLDPATHEWHAFDGPDGVGAALDAHSFVSLGLRRRGEDDQTPTHLPRPADAAAQSSSLFELAMPGVLTLPELSDAVRLDSIPGELKHGARTVVVPLSRLVSWDEGSEDQATSLKGAIAELAAAVGPDVANAMVVHFG